MKTKKKISPFEFAIMQISDPEEAEKCEPYTKSEVLDQRKENIMRQISKIKIKK